MSHVFISYSTHDADYANRLADSLRTEGLNVWIDNTQLRSSEDWWRAIVLAIDACSAFVVLLSPHSDRSKWVQREITLADQRNKPLFPILLAGDINTPNWALFVRTQYEDMRAGNLPGKDFFDKLAQSSPRQSGQGRDITDTGLTRPRLDVDPVLQALIDDPPQPDTPERAGRRLPLLPLAALSLLLIIIVAVVAMNVPVNDPSEQNPEAHFVQAIQAAERSDYDLAIDQASRAIESGFAGLADAYTLRGDMYRYSGDSVAALRDYNAALAEDPGHFAAHLGRGLIFRQDGSFDLAIDNFQAALEQSGNEEERGLVLEEMGWTFYENGDYDRAVEVFSGALDARFRTEDRTGAHYALGLSFLRLGELPPAVEHLEEATRLDPGFPEAFRALGEAFEALDNPAMALDTYRRYVELQGAEVDPEIVRRIEDLERTLPGE